MNRFFPQPERSVPARILALDMDTWRLTDLPGAQIAQASFAELDAAVLARVAPDQILMPLLSPHHDAMAVVERLQALGYDKGITVIALNLPNGRMVEAELRALGPGARLTLLTSRPPPPLKTLPAPDPPNA